MDIYERLRVVELQSFDKDSSDVRFQVFKQELTSPGSVFTTLWKASQYTKKSHEATAERMKRYENYYYCGSMVFSVGAVSPLFAALRNGGGSLHNRVVGSSFLIGLTFALNSSKSYYATQRARYERIARRWSELDDEVGCFKDRVRSKSLSLLEFNTQKAAIMRTKLALDQDIDSTTVDFEEVKKTHKPIIQAELAKLIGEFAAEREQKSI